MEKIASNSTQDENLLPYFVTMIKIPNLVYPNSGFEPEITPGLTAIIDVIGGKRLVLQYILPPIERAQQIVFRENLTRPEDNNNSKRQAKRLAFLLLNALDDVNII